MPLKPAFVAAVAMFAASVPVLSAQPPRTNASARVILITGSTDGLGREVARRLAATGAHIIVHGRNRERGLAVVEEIKRDGKGSAAFYPSDFASLANVRAFADTILRHYPRIDVLINNAGIWLREGPRQTSADGHELTFAVNYLSGYLLTRQLLPRMIASAPSRIINVASRSQSAINLDDVMQERTYSGQLAYGQSKLAQVMFTFDLAREVEGKRVTVLALHPASQMDTYMVRAVGAQPRTTVDEGATAVVRLVTDSTIANGRYFIGLIEGRANGQAYDEGARAQLRALSERLTAPK